MVCDLDVVADRVEPLLWDNAEDTYGGAPSDGASVPVGGGLPFAGNTGDGIEFATTDSRGMRGMSDAHYIGFGANQTGNVLNGHDYNPDGAGHGYQEFYVTWYVRVDTASAADASAKLIRLWAGDHGGRTYRMSWTTMHLTYSYVEDVGTPSDPWATVSHPLLPDGPDWGTWIGESELSQWHRLEVYFRASTSPDSGDGRILCTTDGRTDHDVHLSTWVSVGGNDPLNRPYRLGLDPSVPIGSYIVEFDDVYIDSTPARVEICDCPRWSERSGAYCEIQPPTTIWQEDTIHVTVNQGSFNPRESAWLYVVRPDQSVNEDGQSMSL